MFLRAAHRSSVPRLGRPTLLGALCALVLSACQTVSVPPAPVTAWAVRRPLLQALSGFRLEGRVAVAVARQGFNANIRWVQDGPSTRMTLSGPLGAGAVQVSADGADLSVIDARGRRLGNAAAREALTRQLGFQPPLASLRYWVLGVPDPGEAASTDLDGRERVSRLRQNGWTIQYRAYMSVGAEWLPRLLSVQRAGVRLRMVVDEWRLK